MNMRGLMAATIAASSIAAIGPVPAFANEQLRAQVGHELSRIGIPARAADGLDAAALARVKLVLNTDEHYSGKRAELERALAK